MKRLQLVCVSCVVVISLASMAVAQGTSTGAITGIVVSSDGAPLPDVVVTAVSPSLIGERQATSDVNGVFALRGLTPGIYHLVLSRTAFATVTRTDVVVNAVAPVNLDMQMTPEGVRETVTVTANLVPPTVGTGTFRQTYSKRDVDALPMSRRPVDIAELAPGLTTNTFTAGQVAIGGAFGYDNVFLVDGVDTNDNIFGTSNTLFIEDAIQETSVLAYGVPASYGRFSGGVINVVTKSGGNQFSGSWRGNFSNPSWIVETPRQRAANLKNPDQLGTVHEGTFGGPVMRDRAWFFAAGRLEKTNVPLTFAQTAGAYTRVDQNRRGEIKATARVRMADTAQLTYLGDVTRQQQTSFSAARTLEAATLITRRSPNDLLVASYSAPVRPNLFATAQFSRKRQQFKDNGGRSSAIQDSPFQTLGALPGVPGGFFYNAPYLDATDPQSRNNHQVTGSLSYLLSTSTTGSHDIKVGAERFVSTGIGGNSQSPTGYVFVTDYLAQAGRPVLDANNRIVPVFTPGVSQIWRFQATRGASIDISTTSLYAQDRWTATPHLTLDLGMRAEFIGSKATGDLVSVDTASFVPRLAAAFDFAGDGRTVVDASYGAYVGRYGQAQFGVNTNVGFPSETDFVYSGPAGSGLGFAPGFDLANYTNVVFANFPTANVRMADDLRAPMVRELTLGVSRAIGRGSVRASYAHRSFSRFVEDFRTLTGGITNVPFVGAVTNRVVGNSNEPSREFQTFILQADTRIGSSVTLAGHYTAQIRNHGSFVGEAAGQPGISSIFGDFPEIYGPALDRLMPDGRLDQFQGHKLRVYGTVTRRLGRFGAVDVSPLWRVNSGTPYSLTATIPITPVQLARNPGYPANDINPAVRQTVFFGDRGANLFKGFGVLDLAATYQIPVWRTVQPWFKVEVYNAFNNQKLIQWDRTVTADRTSAVDGSGIPTGFVRGPRFGQATADTQYPQPYLGVNGGRAVRLFAGIRF